MIPVASDWQFDTARAGDNATPGVEGPAAAVLQDFLFAGETLDAATRVDNTTIGVSSHRVLAYGPDGDGPALQTAHRANVTDIDISRTGRTTAGYRAVRAGVYTIILVGVGSLIELDSIMEPVTTPTGMGMGGVISLLNLLVQLIGYVDEVLLVAGLATALATCFFAARYLKSRDRVIEITRTGNEPLRVPIASRGHAAVDQLTAPLPGDDDAQAD